MITCNAYPAELKVFLNHVYEYKKGVRNMVLYTTNKKYEEFAVSRLNSQNIDYCIQPIGCNKINLFFGRRECIEVIQSMTSRPLNELTPEEDFILDDKAFFEIPFPLLWTQEQRLRPTMRPATVVTSAS